ncbi:nuclear matrix constituent protein 1a-like [Nicotiana tomentosiformis]|uniref:nuclear matrix constituent protein 1a-like n=1 Tax=Nicotiana tomentosiformis TaxID=4098 RepID=UPI00388C56F5
MVEDRDHGKVIPEYITWFHDPSLLGDMPEGSNRRRNDQRAIEKLKEELERSRMTISKQQAQLQAGVAQIYLNIEKDYQSALQVMDKDQKHAKNKAARLEEELASTIGLVRRVEANNNVEMHKLQEDLSIIEEDAHQQQLEFDQQREQFDRERAHWICSKGQFLSQLEEIKKHKGGHQHADFEVERRQWMIERAVLNRRIEEYEGRETMMGNALNTTHIWLQNCHVNMGLAREQVLQLVEKVAYIHDDHRHLNNEKYESPVKNEKLVKTIEPDEMARKMKSLEQNIKNI